MSKKTLVLDANIMIRAVLGTRVRNLLIDNAEAIKFFAPDSAYAEARKYLPALLQKRGVPMEPAIAVLDLLVGIVEPMELALYEGYKDAALKRIAVRDANDWPVLACAMALDCAVWTEDADFFGAGVATWTTDRVALYFAS
jgi:predicted nucleic acid-binding protein